MKRNLILYIGGSDKSKNAGGVKSGDDRLKIIKEINKDKEVSSTIIGRLFSCRKEMD